jgi:hypothetical protein
VCLLSLRRFVKYLPCCLLLHNIFAIDFRGTEIDSFIDGSKQRHFPSATRSKFILQSTASIVSLILLVVGVVVSIYVIRYTISGEIGPSNAQTVASISNAVQIQVMNFIYSFIANALSERENHRLVYFTIPGLFSTCHLILILFTLITLPTIFDTQL